MSRLRAAAAAVVLALGCARAAGAGGLAGMYVAVHAMRSGETVSTLIRDYRTTRATLESMNPGLDLDGLRPGDRVRILSRPGVFQRLQPGLTLSDVASAYQVEVHDLLEANGIDDPRRVAAGLELFIPDAEPLPDVRRRRLERQQRHRTLTTRAPRGVFGNPLGITGRLVISDGFGNRINPITGQAQHHSGTDLVAPWGTPILAARDGVVTWSGWKGGYGRLVVLRHANGFETYYGHASELFVREGESVTQGQIIARVGSSGDATAPHLHFEIRHDGGLRNPARYLTRYF